MQRFEFIENSKKPPLAEDCPPWSGRVLAAIVTLTHKRLVNFRLLDDLWPSSLEQLRANVAL